MEYFAIIPLTVGRDFSNFPTISVYLQEVVLQRPCDDEKLGLTLCYGAVEDGVTDIFIGEVGQTCLTGCVHEQDAVTLHSIG